MTQAATKFALRREMRACRRRQIPAAERLVAAEKLSSALLTRADITAAIRERRPIGVYFASADELSLDSFMAAVLARGGRLAAPRFTGAAYAWARVEVDAALQPCLQVGPQSIREPITPLLPDSLAVCLVPGLAFTAAGARLGYGGGWYDRLLREACARDAVTIGVGFACQLVDELPQEPHDVCLKEVVTV